MLNHPPEWTAGSFSQPGLGGREGEVKELGAWGGNPSVTWNSHLERWLMVWHGWDPPVIHLSSSRDLLHWEPAVRIVEVSLFPVSNSISLLTPPLFRCRLLGLVSRAACASWKGLLLHVQPSSASFHQKSLLVL